MKSKKTVFFGYITFIVMIVAFILIVYFLYEDVFLRIFFSEKRYDRFRYDILLFLMFLLFLNISAFYYLIVTKFWLTKPDKLKEIDFENELLKKKIEQKELKAKLQEGENKNI